MPSRRSAIESNAFFDAGGVSAHPEVALVTPSLASIAFLDFPASVFSLDWVDSRAVLGKDSDEGAREHYCHRTRPG